MKTWVDFDTAPVFALPLRDEIDGRGTLEGMLIEGPQGWGEFSPPPGTDPRRAARWLTAAVEVGTVGWPDPVRGRVPVAATVPAVDAARAAELVATSGCRTASVRVAAVPDSLADDVARVAAVRDALGAGGAIRCDARGGWDLDTAATAVPALQQAAGALEFVIQPCPTLEDISALRARIDVAVAVDQAQRDAQDPLGSELKGSCDIAVLRVAALGGVRRAMRVADECGLPCVVAADPASTIGLSGGLALAGVLPDSGFAAELATGLLLAGDLVSDGRRLRPDDGSLPVAPMPPGPDREQLERFTLADAAAVARWRELLRGAEQYI